MRCHFILVLCALGLGAGEIEQIPADSPAILSFTTPDLVRSRQRFEQGPYGRIGKLPQFAPLWTALATQVEQTGTDPFALWKVALAQRTTVNVGRAGDTIPGLRLAFRVPPGTTAPAFPDAVVRQEDGWCLVGQKIAPALPAALPCGPDDDFALRLELGSIVQAIAQENGEEAGAKAGKVLATLGLSHLSLEGRLTPDGTRERLHLPGARLPLAPLETGLLRGLPAQPLLVVALGVDGAKTAALVTAIAGAAGIDLAAGAAAFAAETGQPLQATLKGLQGTLAFVITPGVPFPAFTALVPADAAVDACAARMLRDLDGSPSVAQARTSAVVLVDQQKGPMPVLVSARRGKTHWIISTDPLLPDALAEGTPGGFDPATAWPDQAGAVGLLWQDNAGLARLLAGFLPMAGARMKSDGKKLFMAVQAGLVAAIPLLKPSRVVWQHGGEGLEGRGENASVAVSTPSLMAGMLLPAIALVRESARKTVSGNNMRQILLTCVVWQNDHDGVWPIDLATLRKSEGYGDELSPKLFQRPGRPDIAEPYLYVRPVPNARAMQPVLIEDPACNKGKGSLVAYGDGHIGFVAGTALWEEAKRLAADPRARKLGIRMEDWSVGR